MSDEVYYQYNPWWQEEIDLGNTMPRAQYLSRMDKVFSEKASVFLTGLRRVGKTNS